LWGVGEMASTAPSTEATPVEAGDLLAMLEQMAVIRYTEKAAYDLFLSGLVKGTTHLAAGHEAVAVGANAALDPGDYVFATYRGHHHAIARGLSPEAALAELMSRATGASGGKGGSMHLTSAATNMLGSYAIVGAHLPMACGAAWSASLRGTGQISVAYFGDGATNIGAFHEALNLAAVWKLPVLFICENNLYMEYTPISAVTPVEHPAHDRAPAYGVPSEVVDGNDVVAVRDAVGRAAARARAGEGPSIIEAMTYRHFGHSRTDPGKYRPDDEVARWLERDPLLVLQARLATSGADAAQVPAVLERAAAVVDAAVTAARSAPEPDPAEAFTDVWADGGSTWRN
jgi:TPP-dependent pyruvate/acetoin dehydrogenase alpha subunit